MPPTLIVLAEDNAELRQLLASGLERVGFEVWQAETGADLVDTVRRATSTSGGRTPALIITDVRMPVLGGLAAIRALRDAGIATPVIVMTAFGGVEVAREASSLHATLIDKPLGLHALRAAVADVLGMPSVRSEVMP